MDRITCLHIKRNSTIYGGVSTHITGCTKHWKLHEKNMKRKRCLIRGCVKFTDSTTGCCPKHSARFYLLNYQMRQKYEAEALQPAKTSELSDEALQPEVAYELSIEAHQPIGTYESSNDEDLPDGLGLFD
ncbi:hypothetical protein RclHR1_09820003 [Rhizophagus clarus]|uniref:Uncharacterized protein n=1 Tax=Rhizophagus clarus TaxID=94130 RepID=A0A2Z6S5N5_9GLOM|nr:hypothetical protein RclHR1_09820003 [Rhizophagus clarus]GES96521.1 hypothetical protein GLOIN_2v1769522 [Rhizophagus clarus]